MAEINKLTPLSTEYPERLKQLPQPPKQLFTIGNLKPLLENPCVAVVGSRKVSRYGREVTEKLTGQLAERGVTIISGLALGVDSVAHQACLDAGGKTLVVLPTPLNKIYPAAHRKLAKDILTSGGALVSEYPEGSFVGRGNFVARNRIVAALADAVLITEAALKSGSLHTARYGLELARDVFAVPGNITSETSEGCNNLLKSGAMPVTSVEDILFALGIATKNTQQTKTIKVSNLREQAIIDLIISGISDGDDLLTKSGLGPSQFNQALTMLEIGGVVRPAGGNHWTLF